MRVQSRNKFYRGARNSFLMLWLAVSVLTLHSLGNQATASSSQFIAKDHIVIDLRSGVEWLRCSVGQQWSGTNCIGEIVKLNHKMVKQAIAQANEQIGGSWRLPSRAELEGLVCEDCPRPKIESVIFPQTPSEPFWSGEQNKWSPKHYWSVNFFTGHTYGRFLPFQDLAVRLVRDR